MTTPALDSLRDRLATATRDVQYVSESEAPFTPVVVPFAGASTTLTIGEVRRAFGIASDATISTRSLDDFFRPLVEDVDPADAVAQGTVPRARALREAIRALAPGAMAFRIGTGPEVRYIVAGVAPSAGGALAGVETIGFES